MAWRVVFPEKNRVAFEEFSPPTLGAADVRVRTLSSLISTGTESIILAGNYAPDSHFAQIFSFPQLKTGVQAVGRVEAVGAAVRDLVVGDRIFMRRAHGSEQVLPAEACSLVPEELDSDRACWCGLAKTAFRAAAAAPFTLGSRVLVIGAGPVGQMAVRWASVAGSEELVVVDLASERLGHAVRGGATQVIAGPVNEHFADIEAMSDGHGPNIVVDTTGHPDVFEHALTAAGRYAKVMLLGDAGFPARQHLNSAMMTKGLTVQATHDSHDRGGWSQGSIDQLFFKLAGAGSFNLSGLITHRFSPADCREAYALVLQARQETMGILFDWSLCW